MKTALAHNADFVGFTDYREHPDFLKAFRRRKIKGWERKRAGAKHYGQRANRNRGMS